MADSIEARELPEQYVLGIRMKTDIAHLPVSIGTMYHELFGYLGARQIQPLGMPYAEYFEVCEKVVDVECGVAVPPGAQGEGRIVARVIPGAKTLCAVHVGPYETMTSTYAKIDAWIGEKGYAYAGSPREVYHSDPQKDKDSSKWVTEIFWPVRKV
ncbi:MAG: GyrI-like domain-containing protein [Methanomassiliicoccales archaeon]|nr:GyrI-like domain-containing protein [Methanomassiliicoccales archaeon]